MDPRKVNSLRYWNIGAALLAIFIILFVVIMSIADNPSNSIYAPKCFLYMHTGLKCPACGIQRSIYELSNGQFQSALEQNALFVCGIIGIGIYSIFWILQIRRKRSWHDPWLDVNKWIWIILSIIILFTIFRNILSL